MVVIGVHLQHPQLTSTVKGEGQTFNISDATPHKVIKASNYGVIYHSLLPRLTTILHFLL